MVRFGCPKFYKMYGENLGVESKRNLDRKFKRANVFFADHLQGNSMFPFPIDYGSEHCDYNA